MQKIEDKVVTKSSKFLNFLWMTVPGFYPCREDGWKKGITTDLTTACHQRLHIPENNKISTNHVPCWVSRPSVRFIFL